MQAAQIVSLAIGIADGDVGDGTVQARLNRIVVSGQMTAG